MLTTSSSKSTKMTINTMYPALRPLELLVVRWSGLSWAVLFLLLLLLPAMLLKLVSVLPLPTICEVTFAAVSGLVILGVGFIDEVAVEDGDVFDDCAIYSPIVDVAEIDVVIVVVVVVVDVAVPVVVLVVVVEEVVVTSLVVVVNRSASPVDGQHRICSGQHGVPSNCPMQAVVPAKNGAVQ